jgi:1-acyl-sn-glycerol-3-phosphate acyltransferase
VSAAAATAVAAAEDRLAQSLIAEAEALLADLGVPRQVSLDDDLECELGLGSIERVELLVRLERAHGSPLLERLLGDARCLGDVLSALDEGADAARMMPETPPPAPASLPLPAPAKAEPAPVLPAAQAGVFARTALVLRRRYMAVAAVPVLVLGSLVVQAFCRGRVAAARCARATVRLAAMVAGLRIRVHGSSLPDTPAILISNHASPLDALVLIAVFDRPVRLTAKAVLFAVPVLGTVLRRLGHLPIARGRVERRLHSYEGIRHAAAHGDLVHFFPEGTITPETGVRPFRLGAFRLAAELGVPLVPIAIRGSRAVLRDGSRWPSPGQIDITVLDAIPPPPNASPAAISAVRDCARARLAEAVNEPMLNLTSAALPADADLDPDLIPDPSARAFRSVAAPQSRCMRSSQ